MYYQDLCRPATRRTTASRLRRDSEDSLSGAKEDLTKDMPNPPQALKVEDVTKQLSQERAADIVSSPAAEGKGAGACGCLLFVQAQVIWWS